MYESEAEEICMVYAASCCVVYAYCKTDLTKRDDHAREFTENLTDIE